MRALFLALVVIGCFMCTSAQDISPYKAFIVKKHNELRTKQKGSNMQQMVWSDEMAKHAERWVGRCRFEHEGKEFGENLAFDTGSDIQANMDGAFESWYAEIKDYNYAGKTCRKSCHYTQLVWSQTTDVGCAMKRCPSMDFFGQAIKDAWYFACWYSPKGNDMTEYPYNKGAPCSECLEGQHCEDGLCAGKGIVKCEDKNENCALWEEYGECDRNPIYMKKSCKKSCKVC